MNVAPPTVDALYVSQPTDETHKVKLAVTVKRHGVEFVAVECHCGASSPLCTTAGHAREWWRTHAGLPKREGSSRAYAGD